MARNEHVVGLGRWLSPDPLGGDLTNPQSLNRYAYALNNPETLTDPLGTNPNAVCLEANRGSVMRNSCAGEGPASLGSGNGFFGGGFSIDGGMSLGWSLWGGIGGMANSFGGASESTAVCMMDNCVFPASGYNEANPQNPDLYQTVQNPDLTLNCSGSDPSWRSYSCAWSSWSLRYVAGPNDALPPGVAATLAQVYQTSAGPANAAFVATGVVLAGVPLAGEAATSAAGDFLFARGTGLLNSGPFANYFRIGWSWGGNARWGLGETLGQDVFRVSVGDWHVFPWYSLWPWQ